MSPTVVTEFWEKYGACFPGYSAVPVVEVSKAFLKSVSGAQTGQTCRVGY